MFPPYSRDDSLLVPSLLCVPFGMTVVPLSQIPSPYPFYIHPLPTGDGAKFSEYPSCKNLHYTHNPYRRTYEKSDLVIPNVVRNLICFLHTVCLPFCSLTPLRSVRDDSRSGIVNPAALTFSLNHSLCGSGAGSFLSPSC